MKCPDCGTENPDEARICLGCGKGIEWWRIRVTGKVGKLNPRVLAALDVLPRTHRMKWPDRQLLKPVVIPADAVLTDGKRFPCTLFVEVSDKTSEEYLNPIGRLSPSYEFDEKTRRKVIMPESVSSVAESHYRTPSVIEEKMDQAALGIPATVESFQCKLILDDGSEFLMTSEDWETEFIVLPNDMPNSSISDAVPLALFEDIRLKDANRILPDRGIKYCLFIR